MDVGGMRNYFNTLNTMEIIHLMARINDKKASLIWQNDGTST